MGIWCRCDGGERGVDTNGGSVNDPAETGGRRMRTWYTG